MDESGQKKVIRVLLIAIGVLVLLLALLGGYFVLNNTVLQHDQEETEEEDDEDDADEDDEDEEDWDDEDFDEEGFDFGDEDTTIYEVECACGNIINFDEETLEAGSIICPDCGETLEFTFEDDEDEE